MKWYKNNNKRPAEQTETEFQCDFCDFQSNRVNGLDIHLVRKYANLEQIHGTRIRVSFLFFTLVIICMVLF